MRHDTSRGGTWQPLSLTTHVSRVTLIHILTQLRSSVFHHYHLEKSNPLKTVLVCYLQCGGGDCEQCCRADINLVNLDPNTVFALFFSPLQNCRTKCTQLQCSDLCITAGKSNEYTAACIHHNMSGHYKTFWAHFNILWMRHSSLPPLTLVQPFLDV